MTTTTSDRFRCKNAPLCEKTFRFRVFRWMHEHLQADIT